MALLPSERKSLLICGGACMLVLFTLMVMNGGGGRHMSMRDWSPQPAAPPTSDLLNEMKALQTRIAELEQRLGARHDRRADRRESALERAEHRIAAVFAEDTSEVVVSTTPAALPTAAAAVKGAAHGGGGGGGGPSGGGGGGSAGSGAVGGGGGSGAVAAAAPLRELALPPAAEGVVPNASWWSDRMVELPGGMWCPKPPPFASAKPALPLVKAGEEKPRLTTELAKKHASADNMLIATYVNYNRLDFAFTLVRHLIALQQPHYLVGALDDEAGRGLQARGVPTFFMSSGLTTKDYGWGTKNFRELGLHKVNLVLDLAKTGVDCLTIDADAFILRDPFPYFRKLPEAEVLTSSDHLVATNGYTDDGLESSSGFSSAFNIGYIFIRASALEFVQQWKEACFANKDAWDQVLFASVLRRGGGGGVDEHRLKPLFKKAGGGQVKAGVLPVSLFASGHTHFVSRMAHLMRSTPYMVHTTFQYGGAQGKRHRLREGMMWEDAPEYYSGPDFLTYELDLPRALVYPNGGTVGSDGTLPFDKRASVEQHFALVHHQLAQVRNGLALAKATGRILILPRLVCGLDRWWAPHSGIIPGSAARLPLLDCPADHVLDVERMGKVEPLLREHSFLCNPRTPASVRGSVAQLAGARPEAGPAASAAAAALVRQIQTSGSKVVRLAAVPDYRAVLGADTKAFEDKYKQYAGLWCCNRPPGGRGAGHIWYDLFADIVPHTDRHNRRWEGPWFPKMGP